MPSVPFDDQYPLHRKVRPLSDAAFRLHTEAIVWCRRNVTDGRIASDELRSVSGISRPERQTPELVRRVLWHEAGFVCESPQCPASVPFEGDGWVLHDYWDYHPTRAKVLKISQDRKAAGAAGGIRSGQARRGRSGAGRSKLEANTKQLASNLPPPPLLPPTGEGKGDGGAALRDGAAPPSPPRLTSSGPVCPIHTFEVVANGAICRACAADAVAADVDDLDQRPPSRSERAQRTDDQTRKTDRRLALSTPPNPDPPPEPPDPQPDEE